ncbi:unnamed protein product, partial [marine sediment metagenome]
TVGGMVLLFGHLTQIERGWQSSPWILAAVSITLPVVTLGTALLMVSRFRYPHLVNQYIRGRRPFGYLVKLVLLALAAIWQPFVTLAVLTMAYTLSGPVTASLRLLRATKASPSSDESPA